MNLFENLQIMNETIITENDKSTVLNSIESTKEFISNNLKLINDQAFANVLREIIFQSNIEWKDVQLIISRHMPEVKIESLEEDIKTEAPKEFFNKMKKAKETLSHFTVQQVNFVKKAYEEVLADIGDASLSERGTNSTQIKNDYISIAIEDDIMTEEEFETIYKALEVIGVFEAQANA